MDSVCYAATLSHNSDLYAITFIYGQKAHMEVARAKYFCRLLRVKQHRIVDISFMKSLYGTSNALTDRRQKLTTAFSASLVVPARNALFLTIASAWAYSIGADKVAYGAHTGDLTHYPDCRPEFSEALARALNLGEPQANAKHLLRIISPASLSMDKKSLIKKGYAILGAKIFRTWSCYSGIKRGQTWLQCGSCESCISRRRALKLANIEDYTGYASEGYHRSRSKAE